jgi:uncharacterized membrane protein YhhN
MTATAWFLLVLAGAAAVVDWLAVARRPTRVEHVAKPLVMVLLIALALVLEPADAGQRGWFVAALVLSLAGDVFLLPRPDLFLPGLAAFLLAHLAYVVGFAQVAEVDGSDRFLVVFTLLPIVVVAYAVHRAVLRTAPELRTPVLLYISVIAAMVVWAVVTGDGVAIAGAALFATSDSILALDRFDEHRPAAPLQVMVTYHLAQGLLVLSLL